MSEKVTCADFGYCVDERCCEVGKECFDKPVPHPPQDAEGNSTQGFTVSDSTQRFTDAEADYREARERNRMYRQRRDCPCYAEGYSCVKCDAAVDAYAAAIGARKDSAMRQRAKDLLTRVGKMDGDEDAQSPDLWVSRYDVTTAIRKEFLNG